MQRNCKVRRQPRERGGGRETEQGREERVVGEWVTTQAEGGGSWRCGQCPKAAAEWPRWGYFTLSKVRTGLRGEWFRCPNSESSACE